jgi:hypothetical protein
MAKGRKWKNLLPDCIEYQGIKQSIESAGNEVFDGGIDHAAAAAEERKRLEREANDFDLWVYLRTLTSRHFLHIARFYRESIQQHNLIATITTIAVRIFTSFPAMATPRW